MTNHRRRLRVLMSYHYFREALDEIIPPKFAEPYPEIFADSGGYSAETLGVPIDVGEYADWLHQNRHWFTAYANLDDISNLDATQHNQQYLEDQGLQPIPVFHVGEPWSVLQDLIEDYPYIALGGLVSNRHAGGPALARFMVRAFSMAEGLSVYHGFGMTTWRMLKALPWYSADSSSWVAPRRFGEVTLFISRLGKYSKLKAGDVDGWQQFAPLASVLGFGFQDFATASTETAKKMCDLAVLSSLQAEDWLRRRHGDILLRRRGRWRDYSISSLAATGYRDTGDTPQDSRPGLRVYLAADFGALNLVRAARRIHNAQEAGQHV